MEGINLKHKILAIAEEEGVARASYALKILQSEGELAIASTGKDPNTGRLVTHEYRMEGPTGIFSTTTSDDIDEELLNRCIVLSANEDREQTRAIHKLQRESRTLEGMLAKRERQSICQLHCNAQRLLRPLRVINPYAGTLTFLDNKTRTRRDHEKYLTLMDAVTLLHQYQRQTKTVDGVEYLETTLEDIAIANRLANEVLGRSLDELLPQTRKLLIRMDQWAQEICAQKKMNRSEFHFSRKEVRDDTGWHDTVLKKHLDRLAELEYLLVHRGTRGQSYVYELLYDGSGYDGKSFLMGLIDVNQLAVSESSRPLERSSRPLKGQFTPPFRPQNAPLSRGSRPSTNSVSTNNGNGFSDSTSKSLKNAYMGAGEVNGVRQLEEAI
jgi:hypothetical protein